MLGLICLLVIGATLFTLVQSAFIFPSIYRVSVGDRVALGSALPQRVGASITAYVSQDGKGKLRWPGERLVQRPFFPLWNDYPVAVQPGKFYLDLRLFGILPIKRVTLQVVAPVKVMVGGQSIGVLLHAQGVTVVGFSTIGDSSGREISPARQAGIATGDLILQIEGRTVQSDAQVSALIDQLAGQKDTLRIRYLHRGAARDCLIKPLYCQETQRYRIGLLIRDGAAGVGTLTFFEPVSNKYGALGHMITNSDNNNFLDLKSGRIVSTTVAGIQKGGNGRIGEKIGMFYGKQKTSGSISKNTRFGIFGRLQSQPINPLYSKPIPVAVGRQLREGPASIVTVLSGEKLESFQVEIQDIFAQPRSDGKSFVIKVTDPRLLARTGGIIQGMSGSPVIQDGKLVGAVTHVFINDPIRGYGVFAESMLEEAGLLNRQSAAGGLTISIK